MDLINHLGMRTVVPFHFQSYAKWGFAVSTPSSVVQDTHLCWWRHVAGRFAQAWTVTIKINWRDSCDFFSPLSTVCLDLLNLFKPFQTIWVVKLDRHTGVYEASARLLETTWRSNLKVLIKGYTRSDHERWHETQTVKMDPINRVNREKSQSKGLISLCMLM